MQVKLNEGRETYFYIGIHYVCMHTCEKEDENVVIHCSQIPAIARAAPSQTWIQQCNQRWAAGSNYLT